jgi:hypothetical protein
MTTLMEVLVYSNLTLAAVNLACLLAFTWRQYHRNVKYYDRSILILENEQGEWFVNYVIERELAKLFKHYTKKKMKPRQYDDESDSEESDESDSEESEIEDSEIEESDESENDESNNESENDCDDDCLDGCSCSQQITRNGMVYKLVPLYPKINLESLG